ncbi:MAG TPA: ATP-binding protein [Candidatus Baltobacteraceae bacterium]|nr:ATP-binding protein [Candidatus Baltobacteraceae bacterium]
MSLRRRIALTITVLVAASSIVFAAISLVVLERTLRAELDAKLTTLALAVGEIADVHHGVLSIDARDVLQIKRLHVPEEHIAVLDREGRLFYGEAVPTGAQAAGYRFARTTKLDMTTAGFGTVVTWQSDRWIADVARASLTTFSLVGVVLVIIAALFSRALANAMLGPVERIAQLAEQIEARDLSKRIRTGGNDELSRLCASFDRMLDRLEASFETERRFVADASHELRTPLAVARAETDLALRRPRDAQKYRAALESIDGELTRIELLVDGLLDTMRDRAVVAREPVNVAAVVTRVAERMRNTAREVRVAVHGDRAVVRGHGDSIERATTAVLHNAATHGGGGTIGVRIVADARWVRVDVADDGPGFCGEALVHATERFWRADSARSRGGTGLGLSIARVLIEAHGGEVRLANGPGRGAVVSLLLPAN